jgi:iron complex outermembrane receptor protein
VAFDPTATAIMVRIVWSILLSGAVIAACPSVSRAQGAPRDLAYATLEELLDIRVTSPARKSQRAEDVPAAIYVITRNDIRQSGLMILPEILRLAPGVQVAQVSASKWAVSIRGFNNLYSNKLLVLIDGRSVYSRTFSGVFWDIQDLAVPDIDRIEVIRGPGGTAWGANAVNGVINIITRPATDTQGLAVDASAGTFARERVGVRYGGAIGGTAYRVFSQWSGHRDTEYREPAPFSDRWRSLTSGARLDWSGGADAVLAQGHVTMNRTRAGLLTLPSLVPGAAPTTDEGSRGDQASVLGRWTRSSPSGRILQVQAYHTTTHRDEPVLRLAEYSSDVDAQYETRLGSRHGLVFASGYRYVDVATVSTRTMRMGSHRINTFSASVEDEVAVRRNLSLTLGVKIEDDTFDDWELIPSAQAIWAASPGQRVWAAVSRTHRVPSISDRDFRLNVRTIQGPGVPVVLGVTGNPDYRHERFRQAQAGHRIRIGATAALETTVFSGSYEGLRTLEPLAPTVELTPAPPHVLEGVVLANLLDARMSGVEINARWNPLPHWEIETSYSHLHTAVDVDRTSLDLAAAATDGSAPGHQWEARSTIAVRPGVEVGAAVWRVGALRQLAVPAYTRLDARAEFRLSGRLTAAAVAQNLLDRHHQEFASESLFLTSRVPRSARLDLRWAF